MHEDKVRGSKQMNERTKAETFSVRNTYSDCYGMYSISIGVEQWTYDSMHIANTSIWMALMNNNCAECSSMWIALHVLCTQFFEWVCLSWQLIQRQKLQHVCAHSFKISLSFFCLSFFMFIFFNVSAIRCRHNRLLSSTHSALTPTSLQSSSLPKLNPYSVLSVCVYFTKCVNTFSFPFRSKWLWQTHKCCCCCCCLRCCP